MKKLAAVDSAGWQGAYSSMFGPNPLFLLFVVILTSLGTWGLPQMVGKFYAIKSEKDISKGTIISTVFAIIVAGGCYFLGGFGRLFADKITYQASGAPLYDSIVPAMLTTLPDVLIAVVIVLVLSASMSTLSSLVLTSSSTLTLDMIKPLSKKDMSEKKQIAILRVFIVFFIAVSAAVAIIKDSFPGLTFIAQMMGVSWGALAGAFLAPFLYGLYWKRTTKVSCVVCFIWGCALEIFQLFVSLGAVTLPSSGLIHFVFQNSIYSGAIAMLGGLIIVPLVSLLGRQPEHVDEMFACYDKKVTVRAASSL